MRLKLCGHYYRMGIKDYKLLYRSQDERGDPENSPEYTSGKTMSTTFTGSLKPLFKIWRMIKSGQMLVS